MKDTCTLVLRSLCTAVFGFALVACDSSSPGTGAASGSDGSGAFRAGATVGGEKMDFSGDMKYVTVNDRHGLELENINDHRDSWVISYINPAVGTYRCDANAAGTPGYDSPAIALNSPRAMSGSSAAGGDCVINVNEASDDGFAGTFSGTIVNATSGNRYSVNNGTFDVVFVNAIPDADEDGLSDADDNCPFIANVDQADADSDGLGDACTPEEEEASPFPAAPFPLSIIVNQ